MSSNHVLIIGSCEITIEQCFFGINTIYKKVFSFSDFKMIINHLSWAHVAQVNLQASGNRPRNPWPAGTDTPGTVGFGLRPWARMVDGGGFLGGCLGDRGVVALGCASGTTAGDHRSRAGPAGTARCRGCLEFLEHKSCSNSTAPCPSHHTRVRAWVESGVWGTAWGLRCLRGQGGDRSHLGLMKAFDLLSDHWLLVELAWPRLNGAQFNVALSRFQVAFVGATGNFAVAGYIYVYRLLRQLLVVATVLLLGSPRWCCDVMTVWDGLQGEGHTVL